METAKKTTITVEARINAPVEKVWKYYNTPEHITQWNHASDDWFSPSAKNDLRAGGSFSYRMEARDGSMGFDYAGVFDKVEENELLELTIGDGRKVVVSFVEDGDATKVVTSFEAENTHSVEMQRGGWQAILDNFKKYVEA